MKLLISKNLNHSITERERERERESKSNLSNENSKQNIPHCQLVVKFYKIIG